MVTIILATVIFVITPRLVDLYRYLARRRQKMA
jgi:hypothetical protein